MLNPRGAHRRPLGESPNQFIQELFRTDLEVEGVSAVLDTDVEELIALESKLSASVPRASLSSPLYSGQHTASANKAIFWFRALIRCTISTAASLGLSREVKELALRIFSCLGTSDSRIAFLGVD
jgi:hypothetical protein